MRVTINASRRNHFFLRISRAAVESNVKITSSKSSTSQRGSSVVVVVSLSERLSVDAAKQEREREREKGEWRERERQAFSFNEDDVRREEEADSLRILLFLGGVVEEKGDGKRERERKREAGVVLLSSSPRGARLSSSPRIDPLCVLVLTVGESPNESH